MTSQPSLFDARAKRDDGMARADANVDDGWRRRTEQSLHLYLVHNAEFFVDDFWTATDLQPPEHGTSRALGPIVQRAARAGWIVKTGAARPSVRSNMQLKPVWRSTLHRRSPEAVRVNGEFL